MPLARVHRRRTGVGIVREAGVHRGEVVGPRPAALADRGAGRDELGEGPDHLGSLGGRSHDEHGPLHDARLLLDAARSPRRGTRTRAPARGTRGSRAARPPRTVPSARTPDCSSARHGARVQRQQDRERAARPSSARMMRERHVVVDVLGPVERREHVAVAAEPEAVEQPGPFRRVRAACGAPRRPRCCRSPPRARPRCPRPRAGPGSSRSVRSRGRRGDR